MLYSIFSPVPIEMETEKQIFFIRIKGESVGKLQSVLSLLRSMGRGNILIWHLKKLIIYSDGLMFYKIIE